MLEKWNARPAIDAIDDMLRTRTEFETPKHRRPFTARPKGDRIEVRNSKGNIRAVHEKDIIQVVKRLHASQGAAPGLFQDVTYHASYVLALLLAATRDAELEHALEIDFVLPEE